MSRSKEPIPSAPPPWTLKATVYFFATHTSAPQPELPPLAYSALEGNHLPFTNGSRFVGGLGSIQLIRYTESPVGPYDELLIVPGYFEWVAEEGGKRGKRENVRVSRIYVSTSSSAWNGRKNWNIPKHLAQFKFAEPTPGSMKVAVYPLENSPNSPPFFTATYNPIPYVPNFPFSSKVLGYIGANPLLVQPPLPRGKGEDGKVLVGTEHWRAVMPHQYSGRTSLGWWDLRQDEREESGTQEGIVEALSASENWWPGGGRWRIGCRMENAVVVFGDGEIVKASTDGPKL